MVLQRQQESEILHARQVISPSDERVLDSPTPTDDGPFGIGGLIASEHFVDRRVADGMREHAPSETVVQLHRFVEPIWWRGLKATELPALAVRLFVRLPHEAPFKSAVDGYLHSSEAEEGIAVIGRQSGRLQ